MTAMEAIILDTFGVQVGITCTLRLDAEVRAGTSRAAGTYDLELESMQYPRAPT